MMQQQLPEFLKLGCRVKGKLKDELVEAVIKKDHFFDALC